MCDDLVVLISFEMRDLVPFASGFLAARSWLSKDAIIEVASYCPSLLCSLSFPPLFALLRCSPRAERVRGELTAGPARYKRTTAFFDFARARGHSDELERALWGPAALRSKGAGGKWGQAQPWRRAP